MDFRQDGDNMGGGGGNSALMGLLAGSALNKDRDRDDGKTTLLAAIVFVIVFIIAIIAFAMMFRDNRKDNVNGTDYAALLTPIIAAKSMDHNGGNSNFDMLEIKQKLEHNEDRSVARETQHEIGALGKEFTAIGFGLSGQIHNTEKTGLENFAKIENQLGMQSMALQQLLQKNNNEEIIQGVIARMCGNPCFGSR